MYISHIKTTTRDEAMTIKVTDIFRQSGEPEFGIPPHYCVQYLIEGDAFVSYEYFATREEANKWALDNGADEQFIE